MAQAKKAKTKERDTAWVWKSSRVKKLLAQPARAPEDLDTLTVEEIDALIVEGRGTWADREDMKDSEAWVRGLREGRKLQRR
jgi:hypothetical protein